MQEPNAADILSSLRGTVVFDGEEIVLGDRKKFREKQLDGLVYHAVFHSDPDTRLLLRWLIRAIALSAGVVPASIRGFYRLKGEGKREKITVPAFNIRGMTYDVARAAVRAARANNSMAFIFEIAASEMDYTDQPPGEYAAVVMAAALREGWSGPLFIQGDHFQFKAAKYAENPAGETDRLKILTRAAIESGFYNIDIDASTLVDLSQSTLEAQQRANFERTAEMTRFIREIQPEGVAVSVGGEIGEVGGKNSTPDELRTFMDGYIREMGGPDFKGDGLAKISVQTGTTHGGVVLPDGKVADVAIDFAALKQLSELARSAYRLAGAVQHGASTLPESAFEKFAQADAAEVHLATSFQNLMFDGGHFPHDLYGEIVDYLKKNHASDRKPDQTDEQFIYTARKKAFGPFKKKMWDLPVSVRDAIAKTLEGKFDVIFKKLGAANTIDAVSDGTDAPKVKPTLPEAFKNLLAR